MTAVAQQPGSPVPQGSPSRISDWALAGVIWSDASLARKLASQAAKEAESAEQATQFERVAKQSTDLIDAMESFGWKQVRRSTNVAVDQSTTTVEKVKPLPDPEVVGAKLAESLERRGEDSAATRDPSTERFDPETPVGSDGPAINAQARGRGEVGLDGYRETQTRSATLPYAQDSVYDSYDDDPDADYQGGNPLGTEPSSPESKDLVDQGADIDVGERTESSRTNLDHYTSERSKYAQDANWVQFHLDANQSVWREFTTRENLGLQTRIAVMKLKADMKAAMHATGSEQLRNILRQY